MINDKIQANKQGINQIAEAEKLLNECQKWMVYGFALGLNAEQQQNQPKQASAG